MRQNKGINTHVFVTDYDSHVRERLNGKAVVLYVKNVEQINEILLEITEPIKIHAIVYENIHESLESLIINPQWGQTPIILIINRLGEFGGVFEKINLLRMQNVLVFFSADNDSAITDAKILASLGIHSGIIINPYTVLFDELSDLVSYTFYGLSPHAAIEPFSTMENYYCGKNYVYPTIANFDNPDKYLHVDCDGNFALSREELLHGEFFDAGWEKLDNIAKHEAIKIRKYRWQKLFINNDECTYCPAFRVCIGYFSTEKKSGACVALMNTLLEGIEFYKKNKMSDNICQL